MSAMTIWQGGMCVTDCYAYGFEMFASSIAIVMALLTRRWIYLPVAFGIGALLFLVAIAVSGPGAPIEFLQSKILNPVHTFAAYQWAFFPLAVTLLFVFAVKRVLIWAVAGDAAIAFRLPVGVATLAASGIVLFLVTYSSAPSLLPRRVVERAAEALGDAPPRCKLGDAAPIDRLPAFRGYQPPERALNVIVGMPDAYAAFPAVYSTWMSFEHMLTRVEVIHVPDVKRYEPLKAIAVEVAVSEAGQVLAVKPTAGPHDLYPRAIEIASRWKFLPFTRDGKAVAARLVRLSVPIGGPEARGPHMDMPRFHDWEAVTIKLENSRYEDSFRLEIRGDGSVTFDGGGDRVALKGRHCAVIPRETIKTLVDEIRRADFFSMLDSYQADTSVSMTVALDDSVKQVQVSEGSPQEAKRETPESFWRLLDAILAAVDVDRFVKADEYSGRTLTAERWDFARSDDANLWMLAGVARGGDVQAVRDLLALNAPVMTAPRAITGQFNVTRKKHTALEIAAERGAFDIVRVLLDAPVQWSADALGGAYVGTLAQGNSKMAQELLSRGANPGATGSGEEMNELMAAASTGLPDAVGLALKRSPDINAGARNSMIVALHWAAGVDYPRSIDSARADRGRVIDMLIKAGAKTEVESGNGTPLVANWMGLENVAAALIRHGADVNATNYEGETALMTNKSVGAVKLLLAAGADPYLQNREGQNAIEVAQADVFAQDIVPVLGQWMATHPPHTVRH